MARGSAGSRSADDREHARIVRMLSRATLVNCIGAGLFVAGQTAYLSRSVGLTATEIGLGFAVGGAVGLVTAIPLGSLADRYEPRLARAGLQVVQALVTFCFLFVDSLASFLVVVALESAAATGNLAVRSALISAQVGEQRRMRTFAQLRVVASIGIAIGAAGAGLVISLDTRPAYQALIVVDALTFALSALLVLRLPRTSREPSDSAGTEDVVRGWRALRDLRFVVTIMLTSVLSMHSAVLSLAVPLWIFDQTSAPHATVSAIIVVNTLLTLVLAVPLSRGADAAAPAARQCRRAGLALALAMVLFSQAADVGAVAAVSVLMLAAVVYTVGDLLHANGSAGLTYALSARHALGAYSGVQTLGDAVAEIAAPLFLTAVVLTTGTVGWLIAGAVFVLAGIAVPVSSAWAEQNRAGAGTVVPPETADAEGGSAR